MAAVVVESKAMARLCIFGPPISRVQTYFFLLLDLKYFVKRIEALVPCVYFFMIMMRRCTQSIDR